MSMNSPMQPPPYFHSIAERAKVRWEQLEADPELAGPWHQLFKQVQSPRHVVSELLQNADDAGATWVDVRIEGNAFVFEHNGRDFVGDEFASLCRFGYSNKRSLHTIGFRGIGFKSLFSIGNRVLLATPTLSVCFERHRFTFPRWMGSVTQAGKTTIRVEIESSSVRQELERNFLQWSESPISLLFFASIRKLSILGGTIEKQITGSGPCPNSQWVSLTGTRFKNLLHIRSAETKFPAEAVNEIQQERNTEDLNLPPCRVEIVLARDEQSRVYVVLPTGVSPKLPFSCHAPFLQDPARFGIKEPSISPTNRWLLSRVGRLASHAMLAWLDNRELGTSERAEAYALLPPFNIADDELPLSVAEAVRDGFREEAVHAPVLLSECGELAFPNGCVAFPSELHQIWDTGQLRENFQLADRVVLSADVDKGRVLQLAAWDWLQPISESDVMDGLSGKTPIVKPDTWISLGRLWRFVRNSKYRSFGGNWLSNVSIIPVDGETYLSKASSVVRLSARSIALSKSDLEFLINSLSVIDSEWLDVIKRVNGGESESSGFRVLQDNADERENDAGDHAADDSFDRKLFYLIPTLLKELGLDTATPADKMLSIAFSDQMKGPDGNPQTLVRIAHIYAALDAIVPENFRYINRIGEDTGCRQGLMYDPERVLESFLPASICDHKLLHSDYDHPPEETCTPAIWRDWAASEKSRLTPMALIQTSTDAIRTRAGLEEFIAGRGGKPPEEFNYKRGEFEVKNARFVSTLVEYFEDFVHTSTDLWAELLGCLLKSSESERNALQHAVAYEVANNGQHRRKAKCDPVKADWIWVLAQKPCLRDTYGQCCVPAELLLRSPDTEPMLGIDSFVSADIDIPDNRSLLLLLGARDKATGTERIVERVRALSQCDVPPVHELAKWYEALDRAAIRASVDEIAELRDIFANERLIWSSDEQWSLCTEVFGFSDADVMPDAALVHSSVVDLPLWNRVGVADRPSLELILQWIQTLPAGDVLETPTARRVRSCLQNFPRDIVDHCNAWLTIDNRWVKFDQLRYRFTSFSDVRISDLFVAAKNTTADLRHLPETLLSDSRFNKLTDLGMELSFSLSGVVHASPVSMCPEWMHSYGSCMKSFCHSEQDVQERVRACATRMTESQWQSVDALKVTPYLDGVPVGQSQSPSVLWSDKTLYVADEPLMTLIEVLVAELEKPFALSVAGDALRICFDRSADFVMEYLRNHFDLENPRSENHDNGLEAEDGPEAGTEQREPTLNKERDNSAKHLLAEELPDTSGNTQSHRVIPACEEMQNDSDAESSVVIRNDEGDFTTAADVVPDPEQGDNEVLDGPDHGFIQLLGDDDTGDLLMSTNADSGVATVSETQGDKTREPDESDHLQGSPLDPSFTEAVSDSISEKESDPTSGRDSDTPSGARKSSEVDNDLVQPAEESSESSRPPTRPVIERYAEENGFAYDAVQKRYVREDGYEMRRSSEIFHWDLIEPSGQMVSQIWLSGQSLSGGAEIQSEVWEMIRSYPKGTSVVIDSRGGELEEYSGQKLLELVDRGVLKLFPAKYRLKQMGEIDTTAE